MYFLPIWSEKCYQYGVPSTMWHICTHFIHNWMHFDIFCFLTSNFRSSNFNLNYLSFMLLDTTSPRRHTKFSGWFTFVFGGPFSIIIVNGIALIPSVNLHEYFNVCVANPPTMHSAVPMSQHFQPILPKYWFFLKNSYLLCFLIKFFNFLIKAVQKHMF